MRSRYSAKMLVVACAIVLAGCGASSTAASRDVKTFGEARTSGGRVSQVELQQNVQRVATVFMDRIAQAGSPPASAAPRPALEDVLAQRILLYNASALDIATGPFPELNTLDMLVFALLCRNALEQHWIPGTLGQEGQPLLAAFKELEKDLWDIAPKILDPPGETELRELVADWQRSNPDQFLVEGVRFQEFSEFAGAIESARAQKARGVLRKVKAATQAADQALLMGERAFFVAYRLPFLLRLQARIGVQETLTDTLSRLGNVKRLFGNTDDVRPVLENLVELTDRAGRAAHEGRMLVEAVDPQLQRLTEAENRAVISGMGSTLESANRLADRSLLLIREMRGSLPNDPERSIAAIEARLDGVLRRWVVYLLIVGFAWSVFFWTGYAVVKRLTSARAGA